MNHLKGIVAVIPAAGSGRRMNVGVNKVWLSLCGQSVFAHTLNTFLSSALIDHIVLVVNPLEIEEFQKFLAGAFSNQEAALSSEHVAKISLVTGGAYRQQSVANALLFLRSWSGWRDANHRLVVIHDAARALLTSAMLEKAIEAGLEWGAAGIGVPVKDTIKQVDADGFVISTPERSGLWAIQTPQVFDFDLITACYEQVAHILSKFSDDCGIVEHCGHPVKLIEGSYENLKITTPEDLIFAEAILRGRCDGRSCT
jgi:2-C-methyl-D-erythritol 4-phosphate cytidylyltransferase